MTGRASEISSWKPPRSLRAGGARLSPIAALLILGILLGYYTTFAIYAPIYIPDFLFIVFGLALLLFGGFSSSQILTVIYLLAISAISIIQSHILLNSPAPVLDQLLSVGLLLLAVTCSFSSANSIIQSRPNKTGKIAFFMLLGISVLVALERAGPLQPLSDSVRSILYPSDIYYDSEIRDMLSYGFIRPKLFASEPSNLAKAITLLGCFASITNRGWGKTLLILLLLSANYFMIKSPVILVAIMFIMALSAERYGIGRILKNPIAIFMIVLAASVLVFFVLGAIYSRVNDSYIDPSTFIRIIYPFIVVKEMLFRAPLFGFGFGSSEQIGNIIGRVLDLSSVPSYLRSSDQELMIGNAIARAIIELGVLGFAAWIAIIIRLPLLYGGRITISYLLFALSFGLFLGANNTSAYWFPLILLAAASSRFSMSDERGVRSKMPFRSEPARKIAYAARTENGRASDLNAGVARTKAT